MIITRADWVALCLIVLSVTLYGCKDSASVSDRPDVPLASLNVTPVGDDPTTGVSLGPLAAHERKAVVLRLRIPAATSVRTKLVELYLGLGT